MPGAYGLTVSAIYATSDSHGHLAVLTAALREAGLLDDASRWPGGDARLWVLGDLLDRGPDGLGVIALVRRLAEEAAAVGGAVNPLLGNHEVIALGTRKFGDAEVVHRGVVRTFSSIWARNGGLDSDQAGIDDELFAWLAGLPAIARDGDDLMMHSDTIGYLAWGDSVEAINDAVREALSSDDPVVWFDVLLRLAPRHEYAGDEGPAAARALLETPRRPADRARAQHHRRPLRGALRLLLRAAALRRRTRPRHRRRDLRGRAVPGGPPVVTGPTRSQRSVCK